MRISHGACRIPRSESSFHSRVCLSSRENTILRSKLAPRVGVSVGDIGDPSDEEDYSDDASSTIYQDHEKVINRKFGLDPGRVYVIPNAVVADKFKPCPQKRIDKGMSRLVGNRLPY